MFCFCAIIPVYAVKYKFEKAADLSAAVKWRLPMNTKANNTKKIVISLTALLAVALVFFGVYHFTKKAPVTGAKTISVDVIHGDGSQKTFEYHTDREYLGEVFKDEELVDGEESAYGLFITTVDGETIDEANQEWWCITKGGDQLNTGADQTPIADGEDYELTFTIGY